MKRWEGVTTMARGLSLFVHRNGVCVGPGPPSLILYQLTQTPHPHTRTQRRKRLTRAWLPSLFFPPLLSLLLSQDLLHSFGIAFLKLQGWSSLVKKEGDEARDVCSGCSLCTCVCDLYCPLVPIVSVAVHDSFRLVSCGLILWYCSVGKKKERLCCLPSPAYFKYRLLVCLVKLTFLWKITITCGFHLRFIFFWLPYRWSVITVNVKDKIQLCWWLWQSVHTTESLWYQGALWEMREYLSLCQI